MTKTELVLGALLVTVTGGYIYSAAKVISKVRKAREIAEQIEETCENIVNIHEESE